MAIYEETSTVKTAIGGHRRLASPMAGLNGLLHRINPVTPLPNGTKRCS